MGLTTPPCKTIIVTKPSKKEGRPKPTPGCSAEEEEEYLITFMYMVLFRFTLLLHCLAMLALQTTHGTIKLQILS
jgi:hypothetical protein